MPAETHQQHEPVDAAVVLKLLWALLARPDGPDDPTTETPLCELGADDDLAILQIWDAVTEELAERTLAEPDTGDLLAATTLGDLADTIVRSLRTSDHTGERAQTLP